jgi:hypothetical protein
MKILPNYSQVKEIAASARYNVLPVSTEILSDFTTPIEAMRILKGVEGISFVEMTKKDIVRHKLVTRIVNAFEAYERDKKENHNKENNNEGINKN